jgi:hypothetical protein
MKKIVWIVFSLIFFLYAEGNSTDANITQDANNSQELQKNIQKAIEAEKKFKEEQKFYMGDDYNLTEHKVDPKSVDKVPLIEPEYDFDITDLYSD